MMVVCFMPAMAWADGTGDTIVATIQKSDGTENTYTDIQAAINALENGATLRLESDVTERMNIFSTTDDELKDITIDLNGHSINVSNSSAIAIGNIKDKGNSGFSPRSAEVTIVDSNSGDENKIYGVQAGILVGVGSLTIDDEITVEGGWYGISGNGSANLNTGVGANGTVITLNKVSVSSPNGTAIYHPQKGKLNINGGTYSGANGIQMCSGDLTIAGNPIITSTGTNSSSDKTGDGEIPDGAAISIVNRNYPGGAPTVNISGNPSVTSSSGSSAVKAYTWSSNQEFTWDDAEKNASITGGTFLSGSEKCDVAAYIPAGMEQNADGEVIIDKTVAVAEVNGVGYTTLQAAIDAAPVGATVTLLSDITTGDNGKGNNEGVFTISKDVTIAGAGKTITASNTGSYSYTVDGNKSASMFNIENGAKVTFKDLTIDGNRLAKHGLNIFTSASAATVSSVKVENVVIQNCNGYGIVCNGSSLTVDGITTDNNVWGGINVDTRDGGSPNAELIFNNGTINEKNSIYFENTAKTDTNENTVTGTINNGTFMGAVTVADKAGTDPAVDVDGVELLIKGGTYKVGVDSQYLASGLIVNSNGTVTTPYIPTIPTTQKPVIEPNADVTTSLSTDGTTLTIKANDGYEITDVTVNGVSKGAVTTLTGLKTGDKIVIKTQKIETPDDNAALIEAVKNTKLIARSAMSTAKGKKAVKVSWYAADGSDLDFDGYEVFRSLKRYSGFGTTPIFKTANEKYYNTAIKKGNKYYYKVRAYKVIDGEKVYTDWSTKAWRTVK